MVIAENTASSQGALFTNSSGSMMDKPAAGRRPWYREQQAGAAM